MLHRYGYLYLGTRGWFYCPQCPTDTVIYTYGDDDWGDLLTAYDGETIEHDNVGNLTSDGTWTYTWKHGRQLASMTDGTTTISYTYDAEGLRIGKTVSRSNYSETHEYYYNNGNLSCDIITIVDNGETIEHYLKISYDESGRPLVVTYDHKSYYYLLNAQGDVMGLTTVYGVLKVAYTYDAWGNVLSVTGPLADTLGYWNPCRYRGYVYDRETGFYYLQSRYYNPEVGRFINADALVATGQGLLGNNMFAYCNNNPVNGCDPCGSCFHRLDFWNDCAQCGGRTIGDRWNSVVQWCKNAYSIVMNDDVATVQQNLKQNNFSFYKGAMVFSTSLPVDESGFSFGVIVLDDYYESAPQSSFNKTLNHEYGHFLHMQQIGPATYTFTTAIPSLMSATIADPNGKGIRRWVSDNYYNLPAERIADYLGGVNRGYAPGANTVGSLYWIYTIAISLIS